MSGSLSLIAELWALFALIVTCYGHAFDDKWSDSYYTQKKSSDNSISRFGRSSSCVSFQHIRTGPGIFIELTFADGSVLRDELPSLNNKLVSSGSLTIGQEWTLCLGDQDEPHAVEDYIPQSQTDADYELVVPTTVSDDLDNQNRLKASSALTTESKTSTISSSVVIHVDYLVDSVGNASACGAFFPDGGGGCNFRSAVQYCSDIALPDDSINECRILFPPGETIYMDSSLGEIKLSNYAEGFLLIDGFGCTVSPMPDSTESSRLLSAVLSAPAVNIGLSIRNMTISSFDAGTDAGVLYFRRMLNVSLTDIYFSNNAASSGGSVFVEECQNIIISGCVFVDSSSVNAGGAISIGRDNLHVEIADNYFSGCSSRIGGGMSIDIRNLHILIRDSIFQDTVSLLDGGAVYLYMENSFVSFTGCTFYSVTATRYGGALFLQSNNKDVTFSNCTVVEATAMQGGAVYIDVVNERVGIVNCEIMSIESYGSGGAIFVYFSNQDTLIQGSYFVGTTSTADGGAITLDRENLSTYILNCSFTESSAFQNGGALYIGSKNEDTIVFGCIFSDTTAFTGGAVSLAVDNRYSYIYDCLFRRITAGYGGAVHLDSDNYVVTINNCDFSTVTSDRSGGVLYIATANRNVIVEDCRFTEIKAVSDGGVLYLNRENSDVYISTCSFFRVHAGQDGGSIYANEGNHRLYTTACTFLNVSTFRSGGVFYLGVENSNFLAGNCEFADTSAGMDGGVLYMSARNHYAFIQGSIFLRNNAVNDGGAIHASSDNLNLLVFTTSFTSCTARRGGAVYAGKGNVKLKFYDVSFSNNSASIAGGSLFMQSANDDSSLEQSVFEGNTAQFYGGAISVISSNQRLSLQGCAFVRNQAATGGGAVQSSLANSDFTISGCDFEGNFASFGGAIYFGDNHDTITVAESSFVRSSGNYGAGIYITQFNKDIVFTSVVFLDNYAAEQGAALYVLAVDLSLYDSHVLGNIAATSGGIFYRGAILVISACVIRGNKGSRDMSGGLMVDSASSVTVNSTVFRKNEAVSGSSLAALDCAEVFIWNCSFVENKSRKMDGGAIILVASNIFILESTFTGNSAEGNGGAIHSRRDNFTMLNCNFFGNSAVSGSGSAVWLTESPSSNISNNRFGGNQAYHGGGTVYWVTSSGMDEPIDLLKANDFSDDNVALYGSAVATDPLILQLDEKNIYNITVYTLPVPPLVVYVKDYYGQIVRTASSAEVVISLLTPVQCYKSNGYVTGGFVDQLDSGVSNFTSLLAFCDPGYSMPVDVTITEGNAFFSTRFTLSFRQCVRGEYFGDSVCTPCDEGTYSLTDPSTTTLDYLDQQQVCQVCPDEASNCHGDTIELKDGYWRISDLATSPHPNSCRGGPGFGDSLCQEGYKGPVCGICSDGYAYRSSTQECEACSKSSGIDAMTIVFICILVIFGVVAAYIYFFTDFRDRIKTTDDFYVMLFQNLRLIERASAASALTESDPGIIIAARAAGRRLKARIKICITLWQITSLLPFALDLQFPNAYVAIASVLNLFNLNISASSLVTCNAHGGYDAIDSLVVNTLYPVLVMIILWLAQTVHVKLKSELKAAELSRISTRYFNMFLIFTYLILPFTSVQIFQTFSCRDVDPDNVVSGGNFYMTADYSVSCSSSKYKFGFVWAIVSIIVYPIGIPLYYFYLLYTARNEIMSRDLSITSVEETNMRLNSIRLLYEYYKPSLWYWEVVETLQRLLLTGVLVVIAQGSPVQIIVGIAISLFFLKLCDMYRPFIDAKVQSLKEICSWQILGVFFLALLLKADFDSIDPSGLDALFVIIVTANISLDVLHILWLRCLSSSKPSISVFELTESKKHSTCDVYDDDRAVNPLSALAQANCCEEQEGGILMSPVS